MEYINADYFSCIIDTGITALCFGFLLATALKFISYGIFKAISLLNMKNF